MALLTYGLTGSLADVIGEQRPDDDVTVRLETSEPLKADPATGQLRVGRKHPVAVVDGEVNVTGLPATVDGSPLYRLHVDVKSGRTRTEEATGWFPLEADRTLAWVTENAVPVLSIPGLVPVVAAHYDGGWPARPTSSASVTVFWIGGTAATPPAGYVADIDVWLRPE